MTSHVHNNVPVLAAYIAGQEYFDFSNIGSLSRYLLFNPGIWIFEYRLLQNMLYFFNQTPRIIDMHKTI